MTIRSSQRHQKRASSAHSGSRFTLGVTAEMKNQQHKMPMRMQDNEDSFKKGFYVSILKICVHFIKISTNCFKNMSRIHRTLQKQNTTHLRKGSNLDYRATIKLLCEAAPCRGTARGPHSNLPAATVLTPAYWWFPWGWNTRQTTQEKQRVGAQLSYPT